MVDDEPTLAFEALLCALADLRRSARQVETAIRRSLKVAEMGADTLAAVSASGPASTRLAMNDALKRLETARHRARLAVFASALDDGVSIGELGRTFGFSRQMAARYAKEARRVGITGDVPTGRGDGHGPGHGRHRAGRAAYG